MPPDTPGSAVMQSRPRAALSRLCPSPRAIGALLVPWMLASCASGGATPMGDMLRDAWGSESNASARAADISFASLALQADDRRGLVVLGALAEPESYWPTGNRGLVTLRHEGLHATAGLGADLLDTRFTLPEGGTEAPWRLQAPVAFGLTRSWKR